MEQRTKIIPIIAMDSKVGVAPTGGAIKNVIPRLVQVLILQAYHYS